MPTQSFVGYVRAARGLLLGGVTDQASSRFEREQDAKSWAETAAEINRTAGRQVAEYGATPVDLPPEIMAADLA